MLTLLLAIVVFFLFVSSSMIRDNRAAVKAYNHCQFDPRMQLFFYNGSTPPQVFVKIPQQRNPPVTSSMPYASCHLAGHQVFAKILEPWGVACFQWWVINPSSNHIPFIVIVNSHFLCIGDAACHDDGNHEQNRGHDRELKGDVFLHGVTLAQHRHISASSSFIPLNLCMSFRSRSWLRRYSRKTNLELLGVNIREAQEN
jgi:hypothetical protein